MRFTTKLLPSRSGNLGVLTLNHPKALHALTLDMIHSLQDVLQEWSNSQIRCILLKSSQEDLKRPVFCAGGDVKAVWKERQADFFHQEYLVNHQIATMDIPIVSFWNGIVMGGGVGLSLPGKYRIATEHSVFAMPETAIGLFPDVGSLYYLPKMLHPPGVANFVSLTGHRLSPADLLHSGLATHYVPSRDLPELEEALVQAVQNPREDDVDVVAGVLMKFHEPIHTKESFLAQNVDFFQKCFDQDTVEDILEQLQLSNTDLAKQTLETLHKMSPTSLKITLQGLQRGAATKTIGEDLQMEYRMAYHCVTKDTDFYEGVRAMLVDKDRNPKWNPSSLEEVTSDLVESFFAPIDKEWEIPSATSKL